MLSARLIVRGVALLPSRTTRAPSRRFAAAAAAKAKRQPVPTAKKILPPKPSSDSFWSNKNIKGLNRKENTSSFFGYKLDETTLNERSAPRSVPIRHSAHQFPGPVCPPALLQSLSEEILLGDIGSLYAGAVINNGKNEEAYIFALKEKFEYLLRGYSACLQGSYMNLNSGPADQQPHVEPKYLATLQEAALSSLFVNLTKENKGKVNKYVGNMSQLLARLEQEAEMFWKEKHSKVVSAVGQDQEKSNVAQDEEDHEEDEDDEDDADEDEDDEVEEDSDDDDDDDADDVESSDTVEENKDDDDNLRPNSLSTNEPAQVFPSSIGASPGPTTAMYDLLLDANALYISTLAPKDVKSITQIMDTTRSLLKTVVARHEADGGPANVNPNTLPTTMTFNALMRTAANAPYDGTFELVRDDAIDLAFTTFDRMFRNDAVDRNSATYAHLLTAVHKFIPNSRSKGNIAYGLFVKACDEGVVDEHVWEALKSFGIGTGCGPEFDKYLQENMDKSLRQLPHRWRMNANKRKYRHCNGAY